MRTAIVIGAALVATGLFRSAFADDNPPSISGASVALLAGYGVKDGYNVGVGGRVGETLPNRLYLGATFVDHLGITNATPYGDARYRVWFVGAEGGYEVPTGAFILRPYSGAGAARYTATRCVPFINGVGGCSPSTNTRFAFWPGVAALYRLGPAFLGVDVRFAIVTGETNADAVAALATAGVHFRWERCRSASFAFSFEGLVPVERICMGSSRKRIGNHSFV